MSRLLQLGLTEQELDDLVNGSCWERWCATEPAMRELESLAALRELRGQDEDRFLGALLRIASRSGGDDQLAGIVVVHQLGGALRLLCRRYWHLAGAEVEEMVVAAIWEQIRAFDPADRAAQFGSFLIYRTRRAVRRAALANRATGTAEVVPLDPQSWAYEAAMERAVLETEGPPLEAADELSRLLTWAVSTRRLAPEDARLLVTLASADRSNTNRTKWMRGACSTAAVTQVAAERGVCTKSVSRARDRALDRLRAAIPAYLEEVA